MGTGKVIERIFGEIEVAYLGIGICSGQILHNGGGQNATGRVFAENAGVDVKYTQFSLPQ
ncbi:hypothetical protein GCM10010990_25800 [Croceicoccus mobilis]|uniref:Uncharacterized protein n=1 Tax=Croceicoccus mobilis TaxID=1703339 RepID=A0A916Z5L5_9SPHN|nr:hypothetical protein GCM10010990_25800 [Croceicoccus mobilis]